MNQITAPDFIKVFITNQEQRNSFVTQVLESVYDGTLNPMDVKVGLKGFEKISEAITKDKDFKDCLMTVAATHGKKFDYKGAKIETVEAGVSYDYSTCGDIQYNELNEQMERLKEAIKARQNFLKAIPADGVPVVDRDTGETYVVYPPVKTSETTLKVSL